MTVDPDSTGRSVILAIGLDGYQALPKLIGAGRGAQAIARLLWRRFSYEATVLVDQQATRGAVNRELERLLQQGTARHPTIQPIESLIIYYAGRTLNEGTLALYNSDPAIPATGLELARLIRAMNSITARNVLLILDAPIAAGVALQLPTAIAQPDVESTNEPQAEPDLVRDLPIERCRVIVCAGDQAWRSRDLWSDNDTSLFTAQIMFGLMGNAASPDAPTPGRITLTGLIDYVAADMKRVSGNRWLPWSTALPGGSAEWVIQAESPIELPESLTAGLRSGFPSIRAQALGDIAHLIERGTLAQKALAIAKLREVAAESDLAATRKVAVDELLARDIPVEEENLPSWREPYPERPGANPLPPPSAQAPPPMPGDRRGTVITVLIAVGIIATALFVIFHFSP